MCTVCTLWNLGKLKTKEAYPALFELVMEDGGIDEEHYIEVLNKLRKAEDEDTTSNN